MSSPDQLFAQGIAHHQRREYDQAAKVCRQLLKKYPREAGVLNLMGLVELGQKHYKEAEQWIRKALAADPQVADFHSNLGEVLRNQCKLPEAIALLEKASVRWPDSAEIWHNLGYAYLNAGYAAKAIAAAQRSLALRSRIEGFYVLGTAMCRLKRYAEAEQVARQGLMHDPLRAELLSLLADTFYNTRRYAQAYDTYASASRQDPSLSTPYAMRGAICQKQGEGAKAQDFYRQAMAADPKDYAWASSYLLNMLYQEGASPDEVFAEHRLFGENHGEPVQSFTHAPRPPGSRIKVGYVSADFRDHAVAHFIEGVLRNHDRSAFEVFCYCDVEAPDAVTARLAACVEHWVPVTMLYCDQLARKVHGDGIDILVDLGGHTAGAKRLKVFPDRPAPVQVTAIGYPATTGLNTMDYRLVDAITDPPGVADKWHTEQLARLPGCFLTYTPPVEAPAIEASSLDGVRGLTFGSFNNISKINAQWVGWVARILAAVPGSRLVIKSSFIAAGDGSSDRLAALFAGHQIAADRIVVLPSDGLTAAHLARYHGVDIALDTFPYNGTTTTCEALWMGVPVVTLAGQAHVSRVGASLLTCVGLPDLVAHTPDEFVHKAVALAQDAVRLRALRPQMRERMAPLTDGAAYTQRLEEAYRGMLARAFVDK